MGWIQEALEERAWRQHGNSLKEFRSKEKEKWGGRGEKSVVDVFFLRWEK